MRTRVRVYSHYVHTVEGGKFAAQPQWNRQLYPASAILTAIQPRSIYVLATRVVNFRYLTTRSDGCDLPTSSTDGEDSDSSYSFEGLRELYESFSQSFDETRESNLSSTLERDTPFYDGSSLFSHQALILIFQFVLRHSLTNTVFTELLLVLLHKHSKKCLPF